MAFAAREVFDPRITVTRDTVGWRFNSAGIYESVAVNYPRYNYDPKTISVRNLLTQSEFVTGLAAAPTRAGVVVADMTDFPGFDTGLSFTAVNIYAYKSPALQPSTLYILSAFVKMEDGLAPAVANSANPTASDNDFWLVLDNAIATGTMKVDNYGYGVYRVSNTVTSRAVISGNTFCGVLKSSTNSTRKFKTTGWQLNKGPDAGSYIPTLDTMAGNGTSLGVLVEEAKTNYLLQSLDLSTSAWLASTNLGRVTDTSGPGGLNATTVTASDTAPMLSQQFSAPGTVLTVSVMMKKSGTDTALKSLALQNRTTSTSFTTGSWNPADGTISGTGWTSELVDDGWYLCTFTQASGITVGDGMTFYAGTMGSASAAIAYKVSSPQIEVGAMRTSYIPTTTAAVRRGADYLSVMATTLKYAGTAGTMMVEALNPTPVSNPRIALNLGNSTTNRHMLYADSVLRGFSASPGSADLSYAGPASGPGVKARMAMSWDSSALGFWISFNGSEPVFAAAGANPTSEDRLWIGSLGAAAPWNGVISATEFYPRKLTNAQLKTLATP